MWRELTIAATAWLFVATPATAQSGEIAYITNDQHSIRLVQPDGTGDRQLLEATNVRSLAWAPDGKLLAYATGSGAVREPQRVYLFDTAAQRTTEVKSDIATAGPIAFFPDGQRLAGMSPAGEMGFPHCLGSRFLTLDIATGKTTPIAPAGCILGLQVAPDGAALIASECSGAPACNVLNVSLPSGTTSLITEPSNDIPFSGSGVVAPDNQTLAYVAHRSFDLQGGPTDLVLADRDGSNPRVVWQGLVGTLSFAPDGTQLAASVLSGSTVSSGERDGDIWVLGVDGSNPHRIAAGHNPAWRPVGGGALAPPPQVAPSGASPPTTAAERTGAQCFWVAGDADGLRQSFACDDGSGYVLDLAGKTVSMFDPANPTAGATRGPWPMTSEAGITWRWVDPDQGRTCRFTSTAHVTSVDCTSADPAAGTDAQGSGGGAGTATQPAAAPDTLTESVRADILAAVDRANAAWAAATQSLDASALDGAVAGQELADDRAELDKLRRQGQTRNNVNTAFAVTDVTLDGPGHATVHTHETWYAEIYDRASGRLVQRTPAATYAETYVVEYLNGGWIVTKNII